MEIFSESWCQRHNTPPILVPVPRKWEIAVDTPVMKLFKMVLNGIFDKFLYILRLVLWCQKSKFETMMMTMLILL